MNVYKILMQQNNSVRNLIDEPSLWHFLSEDRDYYIGSNGDTFAVVYDVEKFKSMKEEIVNVFSQRFISQLIVTNFKFLMLARHSEHLNLRLVDATYKNEMDEEFETSLFKEISELRMDDSVKSLQLVFRENRLEVSSLSFRYTKNMKQLIKVNSNGTITTFESSEDQSNLIPKIIDFLFKGPIVL